MGAFELRDLLCSEECRFGLGYKDFKICTHLRKSRITELAAELVRFENEDSKPSELFKAVVIYVDDPEFWAECCNFKSKLQNHAPKWIQEAFISTTKHQLLRLSGKNLTKNDQLLFLERIDQLMAITQHSRIENLEQDIKYWISNLERVASVSSSCSNMN